MNHAPHHQKNAPPRRLPLWLAFGADVLAAGLLLCAVALTGFVLPGLRSRNQAPVAVITPPPVTAEIAPAEPGHMADSAGPRSAEETKTPWQQRFAEHFSDTVESTDHSYRSPTLSVEISTHSITLRGYPQVWYVADIYLSRIESFRTWAAEGSFTTLTRAPMEQLSAETGAVLSTNGDYCGAQAYGGFYVRNGQVFSTEPTGCDICVLYADGTMETYAAWDYSVEDILARSPWQVWKFGPRLLDEEGRALERFQVSEAIYGCNPRSAIGYYEPGHYCLVVADGRDEDWALGLSLPDFAKIFEELGCRCAYNLDGGASAVMAFQGRLYSRQSAPREIGDILLIREAEEGTE